jgi:hypothetical protein
LRQGAVEEALDRIFDWINAGKYKVGPTRALARPRN